AAEWTIGEQRLFTKAGWTPFVGRRVRGRVVATLVRGVQVYRDGAIVAVPGHGRFLSPPSRAA
ncbi:MAG: hypothetical protein HY660_10805, partial [Armatimonadetes bacterium]|nr:hypothetical protein [Armatimonadota bacterium]